MPNEIDAVKDGFKVGTLKWYDAQRGYGFIVDDQPGPEIFVHATVLTRCGVKPVDGMRLGFKAKEGPKGLSAMDLKEIQTNG